MYRDHIRKHYDHLSRSYRRVADYILNDYHSAVFMTAAGLAQAVDVDTTTVVRFAQRLGYPGFPELMEDIQDQVKLELSQSYIASTEDQTPQARIQRLVAGERSSIEKALVHNTPEAIERILLLIRSAPRIVVLGESYATPIAESFAATLKDAGVPAVYVSGDVYQRAVALSFLGQDDMVIGITPLQGVSGVARVLRFARGEGAATLACTPGLTSEAATAAEFLLYAPSDSAEPALPGLTALFALCAAIARVLAVDDPERVAKRAREIERVLKEIAWS